MPQAVIAYVYRFVAEDGSVFEYDFQNLDDALEFAAAVREILDAAGLATENHGYVGSLH